MAGCFQLHIATGSPHTALHDLRNASPDFIAGPAAREASCRLPFAIARRDKVSAAASSKRLESRRTELMTNKSYAMTMSLIRIAVLAAQITVSPSAAAQSTPPHHDEFLASERTCAFADLAVRPILIGPITSQDGRVAAQEGKTTRAS
jgi:hypothetical protein